MFVRAKNIKGNKYAYLVQNVWKKNKVSQKVKKYLGPIITINSDFNSLPKEAEDYDWTKPTKLIFREIMADMFLRLGFELKNWRLIKEDLIVNLATCKITKDGKDVVLLINGRYLYGRDLCYLQNFFKTEEDEYNKGQKLAQTFSDLGIYVHPDVFIMLYKRIYL